MKLDLWCVAPVFVVALSGLGWQAATAASRQADRVTVSDAWVRESLPGRPATSGYLNLKNRGPGAVRLIGGRAKAIRVVELHEMRTDGDMMKMRRIEGIDVHPGATVSLAPGGLHLMLIGLHAPLRRGERLALALSFSDGSQLDVDFAIRPLDHPQK
jgi:periplasmic copper chaperone A